MSNLILSGVNQGMYDEKIAAVYLTYGTPSQPTDHKNAIIGLFYQNPEEFKTHLEQKVVPHITKGLTGSPYIVSYVDFNNMVPQPFLAISRTDNQKLKTTDISAIRALMTGIIKVTNEKTKKSAHTAANMFAKSSETHKKNTKLDDEKPSLVACKA